MLRKQIVPFFLGVIVAVLAIVLLFGPVTGIVAAQQEGDVVTVQGYVSQYVDDDEAVFTDGRHQVVIETEGSIQQLPLNQPISLTARIEVDDGRLQLKVMSFEAAAPAAPGAAPALPESTITKVSDVLARPIDDQWVTLRGQVTQQVSNDKYLFSDGTGTLVLDTDDGAPPLPVGATITVQGRVDVDDGKVEVNVKGFASEGGSFAPGGAAAPTG